MCNVSVKVLIGKNKKGTNKKKSRFIVWLCALILHTGGLCPISETQQNKVVLKN